MIIKYLRNLFRWCKPAARAKRRRERAKRAQLRRREQEKTAQLQRLERAKRARLKRQARAMPRHEFVSRTFRQRQWRLFSCALYWLSRIDGLAARYWMLKRDEFLHRTAESGAGWESLYQELMAARHPLALSALQELFRMALSPSASEGAVERLLVRLRQSHQGHCPETLVPALGAWLLANKRPGEAKQLIDRALAAPKDLDRVATLRLRTAWLSKSIADALAGRPSSGPIHENPLTDELNVAFRGCSGRGGALEEVLAAAESCWTQIGMRGATCWHDVRYSDTQAEALRARILEAISARKPFSLLRLGDAESYGFGKGAGGLPQQMLEATEMIWWGKTLPDGLRTRLRAGFRGAMAAADVIGLPYLHRLARDLTVEPRSALNDRERKLLSLFRSMEEFCRQASDQFPRIWVEEYCNFTLAEPGFLEQMRASARRLVLVTGFKTAGLLPDGLAGATVTEIPPHARSRGQGSQKFAGLVLPEVLPQVAAELKELCEPGVVVLVCAGFAGKELLGVAQSAGAVALDMGSAFDASFGHQTRVADLYAWSR